MCSFFARFNLVAPAFSKGISLCSLVSFGLLHAFSASTTHAQEESGNSIAAQQTIEVVVSASFEPVNAVGILFSERGTVQQPVASPLRIDERNLIVKVPYREDLPRDTMATAVLYAANGETAMGSVRPVFSPDPKESFLSIPDCAPDKLPDAPLHAQLSALESLVQIRSRRRSLAQVQTAQILADDFLAQLNKLERGFGLRYPNEITPDLPPVELTDRLQRVLAAIQSVKGSEKSKK